MRSNAAFVVFVVLFAGCGEGGESPAEPTTPTTDPTTPITVPPPPAPPTMTRITRATLSGMTLILTPRDFECHDGTSADGTRTRSFVFQENTLTFVTGRVGRWTFHVARTDGVTELVDEVELASEGDIRIAMDFRPEWDVTAILDLSYEGGIWRRGSYSLRGYRRDIDVCRNYTHDGAYRFEE